MSNDLTATILTISISGATTVFTWVVTNFFAEPLLAFYKTRRAIRESLLYAANVSSEQKEIYNATYEELRRHAAALDALDETAPRPIKFWIQKIRGFDISGATKAIIGFSNSIGSYDGSRGVFRDRIRKALRFGGEF